MNNVFAFLPMRVSNELLGDPQALRDRLLSKEDFGEIIRYEERVKARTARRLTALGIDGEGARPRRSTTFDRHQDEPVRSPARP